MPNSRLLCFCGAIDNDDFDIPSGRTNFVRVVKYAELVRIRCFA